MNDVPPCNEVCSFLVTVGRAFNTGYEKLTGLYGYVTDFEGRKEDIHALYQAVFVGSEGTPSLVAQGIETGMKKGTALLSAANNLDRSTKVLVGFTFLTVVCLLCDKFLDKKKKVPRFTRGLDVRKLGKRHVDIQRHADQYKNYIRK